MKLIRSWFWSVPRPQENWAQTIVRVLGNLFRIALSLVIALVAFVLIYAGLNWVGDQQPEPADFVTAYVENRTQSKVTKDDGSPICSNQYPLIVAIFNRSDQALSSIELNLVAREKGSARNALTSYLDNRIQIDEILPPNYGYVSCYSHKAAQEDSELIFSADFYNFNVKFLPPQPWMVEETSGFKIGEKTIELEQKFAVRTVR